MHICLVINASLPSKFYGGTQRVVFSLGKALHRLGHKVTFLAKKSEIDFADVVLLNPNESLDSQVPKGVDIVHMHGNFSVPNNFPSCQTMHGNSREAKTLHPNTIFVSKRHAKNHGGYAYVHNGIDPEAYGPIDFDCKRDSFVFLANAAWGVKNVKGAIKVASIVKSPIDILGGRRLNFRMGFRLTLSLNARFYPEVDDLSKSIFLQQARGLIFPVLWEEPFGLAIVESLYFGVPIFGTPYGSLPEIVNDRVGYISNSAGDLALAASNWESFDRKEIHTYWKNNFTAEIMAKKYIEYYKVIIGGKNLHPRELAAEASRSPKLFKWNS